MTTDDTKYLLLAPYRSHRQISLYPDSRVIKAACGHYAWLSPQGEPFLDSSYTCCTDCGEDVIRDVDSKKVAVPGAMDAVRAREGDHGVEVARAFLRQLGIEELKEPGP